MRVALFATCLVDSLKPKVGVAAVRVLRAGGCDVVFPEDQGCCGQPAWNSGFAQEAARVARPTLQALEASAADVVVVPAGSCATMIKVFWPELFEVTGDHEMMERARSIGARTYEFADFVSRLDLPALGSVNCKAAYHYSCHMLRELRIEREPVDLLRRVPGCSIIDIEDAGECCGFGGLFSFKLPETSVAIADAKLAALDRAGASELVGADSSCLMHLEARAARRGRPVRTRHLAEVLAEALDGAAR